MSDETHAKFWFIIPRNADEKHMSVELKYRDVVIRARFGDSEEGIQELADVLKVVPSVATECRKERTVRRELEGFDDEVATLFDIKGDGE